MVARTWLVVPLAIMISGCLSEAPPDPTPATDAEVATACIVGRVIDEELMPVADASIVVLDTQASARSDTQGLFDVCGLVPGEYRLEIHVDGFEAKQVVVAAPTGDPAQITVARVPEPTVHVSAYNFRIYYEVGYTTLDTLLGRNGVNLTNCNPCDFRLSVAQLPDLIYFEADWTRNVMPPAAASDIMYHIFRAGAPFADGSDIGNGAKSKPLAFNYPRSAYENKDELRATPDTFSFSGSVYCDGNAPCVGQRVDVWLSLFHGTDRAPPGYTALPAA